MKLILQLLQLILVHGLEDDQTDNVWYFFMNILIMGQITQLLCIGVPETFTM